MISPGSGFGQGSGYSAPSFGKIERVNPFATPEPDKVTGIKDYLKKPEIGAGIAAGLFGAFEGKESRRLTRDEAEKERKARGQEVELRNKIEERNLQLQENRFRAEQEELRRRNEQADADRARRQRIAQMLAPLLEQSIDRQSARTER